MFSAHSPSNQGADDEPNEDGKGVCGLSAVRPFASLHVRLFKESSAEVDSDQKGWDKSADENAKRLSSEFEEVLYLNRHARFSDFVDMARLLITDVSLVFTGFVAGVMITLSCLASSGVFKL